MSWGITETASEIEKIKSESADYLNGLNSCGVIDWNTYNYAFDFYADLLMKAYKQGKKDSRSNPCEDVVSRKTAIDAVEHITSSMSVCVNTDECHGMKRMQRQAVIELANMPSAQPDQCEDAISIDWITEYMNNMIGGSDRWWGVKWMLEDWTKWKESKKL